VHCEGRASLPGAQRRDSVAHGIVESVADIDSLPTHANGAVGLTQAWLEAGVG
jgi:hypothetical protein